MNSKLDNFLGIFFLTLGTILILISIVLGIAYNDIYAIYLFAVGGIKVCIGTIIKYSYKEHTHTNKTYYDLYDQLDRDQ